MGVPETLARIVRVGNGVTGLVVLAVVRRPPQRAVHCSSSAARSRLHRIRENDKGLRDLSSLFV